MEYRRQLIYSYLPLLIKILIIYDKFCNPPTYDNIFNYDKQLLSCKDREYEILKENFEIHLNNYVWTAKIIANEMKRYKSGSIILLGSIYGYVAQDPLIYEDTGIRENYNYSIIKSGIIDNNIITI